jgi:ParB family chromosome partitioning protein
LAKAYKKRVLGRGLSAILNDNDNNRYQEDNTINNINEIKIKDIRLNPDQPRTNFNEKSLDQLASSINELGLIQPITVKEKEGKFILISGERRLRAFKKLNLNSIPAYIRKVNDQTSLEMALVENIQRKDLDAIEIAISYKRLVEELKLSNDEMSKKLGKDRSTITNYIRLLKLDPIIQSGIRDKFISMGHGRAIINLESHEKQLFIYEQILKNNLSVRQTEKRVRNLDEIKSKKKDKEIDKSINYQIEKIESKINSKTDFKLVKNKGILSFIFSSKNDLIRILKKLND